MPESQALKRLRYMTGQILGAEDLTLEQQYFREKLKRHNRSLHGFGIISGLKVSTKSGRIVVEPGLALDCEGNELVVGTEQSLLLSPITGRGAAYVHLRFVEVFADPVPIADPDSDLNINPAIHIMESFELSIAPANSNRDHRHARARWLACGQPHALTIAKLIRNAHGWRVDRSYRAPHVK